MRTLEYVDVNAGAGEAGAVGVGEVERDNRVHLKVKLKALAEEARMIRREEKKSSGSVREGLHQHRVGKVRWAARNTLLAYCFIRGRSYRQVERTCRTIPNWKEVERMVRQYGGVEFDPAWKEHQG